MWRSLLVCLCFAVTTPSDCVAEDVFFLVHEAVISADEWNEVADFANQIGWSIEARTLRSCDPGEIFQAIEHAMGNGVDVIISGLGCSGLAQSVHSSGLLDSGTPFVFLDFDLTPSFRQFGSNFFGIRFPTLRLAQTQAEPPDVIHPFLGWCSSMANWPDDKRFSFFGICLTGQSSASSAISPISASLVSEMQVAEVLLSGNTPNSLLTPVGDIILDWSGNSSRLDGQVVLNANSLAYQDFFEDQWPLIDPSGILARICPNCTGTGQICGGGDECPKECGKNACTKSGDKSCCNSSGMPVPDGF